jgi:murein L,D-transpeptidase YafK
MSSVLRLSSLSGLVSRVALVAALGGVLAACQDTRTDYNGRAYRPIPANVVALMNEKGSGSHQPVLIRAFKKEAELEIWKMNKEGRYVHLKTYPMCRWSGQLGPKVKEGDRQVPEGFYTITPGQMNPNSAYYLSFNVGYPNAFDRAHGYTGGSIMVHGACSSAGCFSMTDEQIAEIYAITREAFGGGQRAIQMQSFPFRMTAENLAKHRFDPNMKFWKVLKEGSDQFEVSQRETKVSICERRYVFGATGPDGKPFVDANASCPGSLQSDPELKALVAEKQQKDEQQVAHLVQSGVRAIKLVYADGGQHPDFTNTVTELSRPDALDKGAREIFIDEHGKPLPAAVQMAAARTSLPATATAYAAPAPAPAPSNVTTVPASVPAAPQSAPAPSVSSTVDQVLSPMKWLWSPKTAAQPVEVDEPAIPLPPRRQASTPRPQAALPQKALPKVIAGAPPVVPANFRSYAALER